MNTSHQDSSVIVAAPPRPENSPLKGVKHVIAVGSGKGGVGKSTTAVNLAVALSQLGAKVGLMDADIYGPSVPRLLGVNQEPTQNRDGSINLPVGHGIKCMSMGLLSQSGAPVVWRGPMASKAISQFLGEVTWGELDYLIVDMPPGTGDIQITLAQSARLSGAVLVMTPQHLAVDIAKRGLKMFQQVRVPVIGIVENMSGYECPKCHHVAQIFSEGGGREVAKELSLPLLAEIPLDPELVTDSDNGTPIVIAKPESATAKMYFELARRMAAELSTMMSGGRVSKPEVLRMEANQEARAFKVDWSDGKVSLVSFVDLRFQCPCAVCVDENTGKRKIRKEDIKPDIQGLRARTVGNYAIQVDWSDGHDSGIYSYDYLRRLLVKT